MSKHFSKFFAIYNMCPIPSLIFLAKCIYSVCPIYQKFTMTTRWKNQRLSCSIDAFWQEETNFFEKKVYTWIGIQPRCYNHITLELCKMVTYGQLQKMQYIQWSKKDFEKNFSSLVTLWTNNFYRKFIFESINDDDPSIIFSRNNTQQPLRIEKKILWKKLPSLNKYNYIFICTNHEAIWFYKNKWASISFYYYWKSDLMSFFTINEIIYL